MFTGAACNVSRAWDGVDYHLPFAARLVGLLPRASFEFHSVNQARFEGLPLLAEWLQGLAWRLTGRPESANLVAFVSVPILSALLWRRFGVPWHLAVLALLAIPLVHTHATSAYVDLPANAAASALVLLAIEAHVDRKEVSVRTAVLATVAGAIAANTKALLHPVVLVALGSLFLRAAASAARSRDLDARVRARRALWTFCLLAPVVCATPLKNAVVHGNPYYPIGMSLFGRKLPGPERVYASSPDWLVSAPKPVRFALSVAEVGLRPFSDPQRWTVDQWMPSESRGSRMGGFFGAYALSHLALLAWSASRRGSVASRRALGAFGVLTVLVAWMPQSHELRYYMSWMIVLVALNLWLSTRSDGLVLVGGIRAMGGISLAALAVVLIVTRADYAFASGTSFAELVREKADREALAKVPAGARVRVCRAPWNLTWADPFHPPLRYTVVETEDPDECKEPIRVLAP